MTRNKFVKRMLQFLEKVEKEKLTFTPMNKTRTDYKDNYEVGIYEKERMTLIQHEDQCHILRLSLDGKVIVTLDFYPNKTIDNVEFHKIYIDPEDQKELITKLKKALHPFHYRFFGNVSEETSVKLNNLSEILAVLQDNEIEDFIRKIYYLQSILEEHSSSLGAEGKHIVESLIGTRVFPLLHYYAKMEQSVRLSEREEVIRRLDNAFLKLKKLEEEIKKEDSFNFHKYMKLLEDREGEK